MTESTTKISAQVIFLPMNDNNNKIQPEKLITSENIDALSPADESVTETTNYFEQLGFDIGKMVGISFSITGPIYLFEDTLNTTIIFISDEKFYFQTTDGKQKTTLDKEDLLHLPIKSIISVVLPEPPDFGPRNFF